MKDPSGTDPEIKQSQTGRKGGRKDEEYFKAIIQNSSDIIFIVDEMGTITYASPSVGHLLGYEPEALIGTIALNLIVPDDRSRAIEDFARALSVKQGLIPNDFRIRHKDGAARTFEGVGNNLMDNPAVAGFVMNIRDITDRKRAEMALRESEKRYRALVENASDIIFRTDAEGHVTFANTAGLRITGCEKEELIGRQYLTFIRPDKREEATELFGRQFAQKIKNTYTEYPILAKDGHEVWLGQNTQLIEDGDRVIGLQAVSRDITDRKLMEKKLAESEKKYRELSTIDDLTRLYNSRHFYAQLKAETERSDRYGQSLSLLLLDFDDFKIFNDTYGHIEGDHVLSRLGQVVKKCLRRTDSAYRYGGEEFTVILPMTTKRDGVVIAERVRTEIKKEPFSPVPGRDAHVTVSIGLTQYRPREEIHTFVHRVDQLMYQGKKSGKDRVCCDTKR